MFVVCLLKIVEEVVKMLCLDQTIAFWPKSPIFKKENACAIALVFLSKLACFGKLPITGNCVRIVHFDS